MKKIIASLAVLLAISGGVSILMYKQSKTLVNKTPTASNEPWTAKESTKIDDTSKQDQLDQSVSTPDNMADKRATDVPAVVKEKRRGNLLIAEDGTEYPVQTYTTLAVNDPSANQWWTDKISLPAAHTIGFGTNQTIIAIIDTGVSVVHEEFSGRLYENMGEKGVVQIEGPSLLNCTERGMSLNRSCNVIDDDGNGVVDDESGASSKENKSLRNCSDQLKPLDKSCNLLDDDGNGLIDDLNGFDFVAFERSVQPGEVNANGAAASHGTMVAGIAAASQNNSKGIAGVDGKSKILPIQALGDDGSGDTLSVSRAIRYAADQGAHVINLSLGSAGPDSYMRQAVQYAISKGSVVVAAAGNDGCQCMSYPAAYEEVVAVGASNQNDVPASFSSYGDTLDVLAPGVDLYSTVWSKTNAVSAYSGGLAGTSFATPIVAGLISAVRSHQPNASIHQLLAAVTEKTNRLGIATNSSRNNTLGFGRVDAAATLARSTQAYTPSVRYMLYPVSGGTALGTLEPLLPFQLYNCENGVGTTPLYKLSKISQDVYTISPYEKQRGIEQGFTVTQLGYYCVGLPIDQPVFIRSISISSETENRVSK